MHEQSEWFKLGDAAHLLGISEITLRRKLKANLISHELRFGKYLVRLQKNISTGRWNTLSTFDSSSQKLSELKSHLASPAQVNAFQDEVYKTKDNNLEARLGKCEQEISSLKRALADQTTLINYLELSLEAALKK